MSDNNENGDHSVLLAASHFLNRTVIVISDSEQNNKITIHSPDCSNLGPIWLGVENGQQYVSVTQSRFQTYLRIHVHKKN